MSIKIRPFVKNVVHSGACTQDRCAPECSKEYDGFEYEVRVDLPQGTKLRERRRVPLDGCTPDVAREWAVRRRTELLAGGLQAEALDPLIRRLAAQCEAVASMIRRLDAAINEVELSANGIGI